VHILYNTRMFQTIMKLYDTAPVSQSAKGKYIYFGASIIYCDEKNVCAVYYPDTSVISNIDAKGSQASQVAQAAQAIVSTS
jgi:hypothetical protein